jgi:hypothetical protein
MPAASQSQSKLPSNAWGELNQVVARFEHAWKSGKRPVITDYLPPEGRDRLALLVELIHTELELRLRVGEPARVEEYCDRYPEFAANHGAVQALLAAAADLRRSCGPGRTCADFQSSVPSSLAERGDQPQFIGRYRIISRPPEHRARL